MPIRLHEVIQFLDTTLESAGFQDLGHNGLQIEAGQEVTRVITGVSAHMALFEKAAEVGAELIVVHHGLMWGGGIKEVTGVMARRLGFLFEHGISLAGYHLPLDFHGTLGNNAGLADAIGLEAERGEFGEVRGRPFGVSGYWPSPISRSEALERVSQGVLGGQPATFVFPYGPETVRRVGVCTGAASGMIEEAAAAGCDMFITGELAERASELARELQITLVAAGHHATEVFGPKRLATAIAAHFPAIQSEFVNVPNPI